MHGRIECAAIVTVVSVAELKTSAAGKPWLGVKAVVGSDNSAQWLRLVLFGDLAVNLARIEKGSKLYVEGTIRLDRWQNAEGQERSGLSVAAWKAEKVGASAIGRNRPPTPRTPPEGTHPAPASAGAPSQRNWQRPLSEDAIPFAPAR